MRLNWKQKYIEMVLKLSSPGLIIQNQMKCLNKRCDFGYCN